ncbi:putative defensin-like protein 62 [Capsella rubella]|uniref:putative defensin-like protein 62 n=1 Tax=Capsella rubella TaxID=81985 RepID=UPI000CD4AFF2|nr:putative defensin-like protein 62 [Capsella rubella]
MDYGDDKKRTRKPFGYWLPNRIDLKTKIPKYFHREPETYPCIGHCLKVYGNMKCDTDCKKQHYIGGGCDYLKRGPKTPLCCCFKAT